MRGRPLRQRVECAGDPARCRRKHLGEGRGVSLHTARVGGAQQSARHGRVPARRAARPPTLADDEPWATPLAWATRRGHERIVEMLRAAGASEVVARAVLQEIRRTIQNGSPVKSETQRSRPAEVAIWISRLVVQPAARLPPVREHGRSSRRNGMMPTPLDVPVSRHQARSLRNHHADRRRRHGRGLQGARHPTRPHRRHQEGAGALQRTLRARGARDRRLEPSSCLLALSTSGRTTWSWSTSKGSRSRALSSSMTRWRSRGRSSMPSTPRTAAASSIGI